MFDHLKRRKLAIGNDNKKDGLQPQKLAYKQTMKE